MVCCSSACCSYWCWCWCWCWMGEKDTSMRWETASAFNSSISHIYVSPQEATNHKPTPSFPLADPSIHHPMSPPPPPSPAVSASSPSWPNRPQSTYLVTLPTVGT
ncbi:hypothetical protein B0T17DRAFT_35961 [Bombardia bombarda]|uniref:Secreted protein n=1 Tax=Bombardia bombarda TaxID=252184 RepID=A0AA39XJM2_9PEZI|nr:hypothetical protein B0T17DRAFT_35961 [Bombardia bombarda]